MITLETKRLILRDWTEQDIGCEVHSECTIRYLLNAKNNYAVVLKESGKVIGTIGLNEDADGNQSARNVGIRILDQYQGQGLMSEALQAVIAHAHLMTDMLSWFCAADDSRSIHLAEKFGFNYVKTFPQGYNGLPFDFRYYTRHIKRPDEN